MQKSEDWSDNFRTAVPTPLLRDPAVQWDSKGAYGWIASHRERSFQLDIRELAGAGPRGRDHAYGMLRDLEEHGYLTRARYRAGCGKGTVTIWTLHPVPVPIGQRTFTPSTAKARPSGLAPAVARATELLTVQEAERSSGKLAGQAGTPDRAGDGFFVPDRAGTDRAGAPYMDEHDISSGDQKTSLAPSWSAFAPARDERASERNASPRPEPSEQALQVILDLRWPVWARRLSKAHATELAGLVDTAVADGGHTWPDIAAHASAVLAEARQNPLSYLRRGLQADQLPVPRRERVLPQHQPDQSGRPVASPPDEHGTPAPDRIAAIREQMGLPRGERYRSITGRYAHPKPARTRPNKWATIAAELDNPGTGRELVAS